MKILIKGFKKAVTELKLFYFISFIVALLVIIPIFNFILEGVQYVVSGNFSLGIAGGEEVLETLKVLVLTSFFGGGLGTLNGWLLSNCDFKFRKVLRICQLVPLAAPAYLITAVLQDLGSIFGYQVTGLWWGVLILSISTYPYVFILANESFNKFGVNQINASRGLGVGPVLIREPIAPLVEPFILSPLVNVPAEIVPVNCGTIGSVDAFADSYIALIL